MSQSVHTTSTCKDCDSSHSKPFRPKSIVSFFHTPLPHKTRPDRTNYQIQLSRLSHKKLINMRFSIFVLLPAAAVMAAP